MPLLFIVLLSNIFQPSAHVRILNVGETPRTWSGTIIKVDKNTCDILTCAHGVSDLSALQIQLQVDFLENPYSKYQYISLPVKLIKFDAEKDLALLRCTLTPNISPFLIEVAESPAKPGSLVSISGFVGSKRSDKLTYPVLPVKHYGKNGEALLTLRGKAISGYSGSGIILNGKLVGVQSAGGSETICASLEQIREFLEEKSLF